MERKPDKNKRRLTKMERLVTSLKDFTEPDYTPTWCGGFDGNGNRWISWARPEE